MKTSDLSCTTVKYNEFPDLLFGTDEKENGYFNATHFISKKGDPEKHNVRSFDMKFIHWKNALCEAYDLQSEDVMLTNKQTGDILIDESFALLFVAYIDPAFGVYMIDRMSEMLLNGIVLSDSAIVMLSKERLSKEQLLNLANEE